MRTLQLSIFDGVRLSLEDSIQLSLMSLAEYGQRYDDWAVAYSGGKDSTATVAFVAWAIRSGLVAAPRSLTVLYADTRMELPPLQQAAMRLLDDLRSQGFNAQMVLPEMDDRFFVYVLGRGVPPPKNLFRWCTPQLKVEPMQRALINLRNATGKKLLMLTGVRIGESAARDQRIALSCSKDSGECGQGWFQVATNEAIADTLAPLVHWRLCHVYDWLYLDDRHGYDVSGVANVYGEDDIRTGCVGCNLVEHDTGVSRLIKQEKWAHLKPLLELKPLYQELKMAKWRKRKAAPEKRKDGTYAKNVQRMGPLTMAARKYGLEKVLDIQQRAQVDLINASEEARIREMWQLNLWPRKWTSEDVDADVPLDVIRLDESGELIYQGLLVR